MKQEATNASEQIMTLVTMRIDDQLFGIPVEYVRDVLKKQKIAPIPKAPTEVAGSINLRGRIVTVINLKKKLGLNTTYSDSPMYVVVNLEGDYFTLLVDGVTEVKNIPASQMEACPPNIASVWKELSCGICKMHDDLLLVIDIKSLFKK